MSMNNWGVALEACKRMGVPFSILDDGAPFPDDFVAGPAAGGLSPSKGVFLRRSDGTDGEAWAWVLHELSHLVFWHPEKGADVEEFPLMAWEWAVSRALGARGFWTATYLLDTQIVDRKSVESWKVPRRSWWFKQGLQDCIRCGVLDEKQRPTWKRPNGLWEVA